MRIRYLKEHFGTFFCAASTLIIILFLFLIVWEIFVRALPSLSWYFLFTPENQTPGLGQGIANAVIGTLLISCCATAVATPIGIGTAIYLQRYAKKNRVTETFRFLIEVLSGTPSIILGIFGLLTLVYIMKEWTGGFSLLAGTIALSILIVPVIVRSVENAIESVPRDLEEGSYALGADKWHTVRNITLPVALPGMITGLILAFGRAAEESAVVILTAGYSQFIPEIAIKPNDKLALGFKLYPIQDLVGTLPYSVYHAYINSNVVPMSAGFAAAFILICIVLIINILAKIPLYTRNKIIMGGLISSLGHINAHISQKRPIPVSIRATRNNTVIKGEITPPAQEIAPPQKFTPIPLTSPSTWTLALTQPISVASSHPSEISIATPHPASTQANPAGTHPVDTRSAVSPAAAGHSLPPAAHDGGDAGYHDLLEDDPDGPAEPDPGSTRRTRPPAEAVLLEEPHIPLAEIWRSMTKNQQENMHV